MPRPTIHVLDRATTPVVAATLSITMTLLLGLGACGVGGSGDQRVSASASVGSDATPSFVLPETVELDQLPEDKISRFGNGWFNYGRDPDIDYPLVVVTNSIVRELVDTHAFCAVAADLGHLVPASTSPRDYGLSPSDLAMVAAADFIVADGSDLVSGLEGVLQQAERRKTPVFRFAENISDPLPATDANSESNDPIDSHVWLDPVRTIEALDALNVRLIEAFGPSSQALADRCREYDAGQPEGYVLYNDTVMDEVQPIPDERRVLVTTSDALDYFADRYKLDLIVVDSERMAGARSVSEAIEPAHRTRFDAYLDTVGRPTIFVDADSSDDTVDRLYRLGDIDRFRVTPLHLETVGEEPRFTEDGVLENPEDPLMPMYYPDLLYYMSDLIRADLTETESATRRWAEDG